MIKTDFMKLYEKLDSINEGIGDIDFKALATAEEEAARLEKEIWELERKYSNKVYTAINANEQYKKFTAELKALKKQLSELEATYERREIVRLGADDFDYDYWTDEEAYELVKDRVEKLSAAIQSLEAQISEVEATVKKQFETDQVALNSKKAERDQHRSTAATLKNQLKQSYADVEAEVTEAAEALALLVDEKTGDDYIKSSIDPKLFINEAAPGRILVSIDFTITGDYGALDGDDFRESSGELLDRVATLIEEYAFEGEGWCPEDIAKYNELSPASEEGWYKIPGSDWELWKEYDVALVDAPTIQRGRYEDEIDSYFKVEASIYLGKKLTN